MSQLSLKNIEAGYGDKIIVKDVSLDVRPKEAMVIIGPSGSGKTTLIVMTKPKQQRQRAQQDGASKPALSRSLGRFEATASDVGTLVGSGIFVALSPTVAVV